MSLRTTGLRAGHGGADVLDGVDLVAREGEVLAVLGPSGSGKSTLLRVVAGLHRPTAGAVELGGRDVTAEPPERRGVGLVPQDGALFTHLDVAANTAFGLSRRDRLRLGRHPERHPRVAELLELLGLAELARRMPHELSGGQQQRVALARALAPRPRLVLLDEPFSALDAGLRNRVRDDVVAALRAQGVGALLVTHDQDEALQCADRVAVLHRGRVAQLSPPRELWEEPADAWTARFLGGAALVAGVVEDGAAVRTALGAHPLRPVAAAALPRGARVEVVLRAEQVGLEAAPATGTAGAPAGEVVGVRYLGHTAVAQVRLDGPAGPLVAVRLSSVVDAPTAGDRCHLAVHGRVHAVAAPPELREGQPR